MAKPIKETPTLYNDDAKRFWAQKEKENTIKVSNTKLEEIRKDYARLSQIAKF